MHEKKFYSLPGLSFDYNELEPYISENQLAIHYEKHHKAYVDAANKILEKLDEARKSDEEIDYKSVLKSLSFNIGGHVLHSLFWANLAPKAKGGELSAGLRIAIEKEFGNFDKFKQAFEKTALTVEGSGWAALAYCKLTNRVMLMQIEKHNVNVYPSFQFLLVLDVWEHAYYIDHKNDRKTFIESFWNIVNWEEVSRRLDEVG